MQLLQLTQACEDFYGLNESPFGLTPNTHFYVELPVHQQAFEAMVFALHAGEGFIKVTGEVGTGKTLLCRRLLNYLSEQKVPTAYIPNPTLTSIGLWHAIAAELGLRDIPLHEHAIRTIIQRRLLQLVREGHPLILIVDEAQCLPAETLEALRLISNLETERQKLIQIVLFGQPELNDVLATPRFRQLLQRITSSTQLQPLSGVDLLSHYLRQRLACAGYKGRDLFCASAVRRLWLASNGIPRLVNVLAAKALLIAFGQGANTIDSRHIERAVADTESALASMDLRQRFWSLTGI